MEQPVRGAVAREQAAADQGLRGRRSLLLEWSILLAAMLAAILLASIVRPLERADNLLYDAVLRERPRVASDRLLIVGIDNRSLAALGQWPWPRDTHARVIERLAAVSPRAIGYDVLFLEPGPDDEADVRLAQAMANAGKVVLPYMLETPGYDGAASAVFRPVGALAEAATLGHATIRPDSDGIVRGLKRLAPAAAAPPWPHFADAVLAVARGASGQPAAARTGTPVIEQPSPRIRFAGLAGGFQQASFVDVLEGRLPEAFLKDRIILVGATGAGLGDRFATPLAGRAEAMPGVELLANYIDGELADDRVEEAGLAARLAFTLVPVLLLMASLLLFGPRVNLWLGVAVALVVVALSAGILALAGLWLPPANALAAIALVFPLWGWRRLDVANRYMASELEALAAEPSVLPRDSNLPVGDAVERQIALMHAAIRDVRDLKRFIAESLDSLPDAALVTDLDGIVLIA
ncbi:MAG: CHASE2 domain-containing protein, partial [Sphingomonadaceae bacterium]